MTKRSRSKAKKVEAKAQTEASTNGEAKVDRTEEFCRNREAIEIVAFLANEVANEDSGEFTPSDICYLLGETASSPPKMWNNVGDLLKANPEIFHRDGPYKRWTLVGWKAAAKAESKAQKKAKALVKKQAKALSKNGDDPPEDEQQEEPPPPVEEEPVEEETEPVEA